MVTKLLALSFLSLLCLAAQTGKIAKPALPTPTAVLRGAGATHPSPIIKRQPDSKTEYQGVGSGGGIHSLEVGAADFAVLETYFAQGYVRKHAGTLCIPFAVKSIDFICNVPGVKQDLSLSGDILADIYRGKITRWNDPRILALNPSVHLPPVEIVPIRPKYHSPQNWTVTTYFSETSAKWKRAFGIGETVASLARHNLTVSGSDGMTAIVERVPGGIGYDETDHVRYIETYNTRLYARIKVQNAVGAFLLSKDANIQAALLAAFEKNPEDLFAPVCNPAGAESYPLVVGYDCIVVPKQLTDKVKLAELKKLCLWLLGDGQKTAKQEAFTPLPEAIRQHSLKLVERIGSASP